MEIQESPKGFGRSCDGEQMGNSALVHLNRCLCGCDDGLRDFASPLRHSQAGFASWVRAPTCVCVCVPAGVGASARCVQTCEYVSLGDGGVCACLHSGLHTDDKDGDLALITQPHTAPPRGWLRAGSRVVWCKPPQRNISLSCAGLHQAGIWPCHPHGGG